MKKKYILAYTVKEREYFQLQLIKRYIEESEQNNEVIILDVLDIVKYSIYNAISVILCPPIRSKVLQNILTYVKQTNNCRIVCLVTEGYEDYSNPEVIDKRLGDVELPLGLIDYMFYWGGKTAKLYGQRMIEKKQICSMKQIGISGYIMYDYNSIKRFWEKPDIFCELSKRMENSNKVVLYIGIPIDTPDETLSYGTEEEAIVLQKYQRALEFCKQYINNLIVMAKQNPDILFLYKMHPREIGKNNPDLLNSYEEIREIKNIVIVDYQVPLFFLLENTDLLLHYGSTTLLEAYIWKIPTVQFIQTCTLGGEYGFGRTIGPMSTILCGIDDMKTVSNIIERLLNRNITFVTHEENDTFLEEAFNFRGDIEDYNPVRIIADELLKDEEGARLTYDNENVLATHRNDYSIGVKITYYKEILNNIRNMELRRVIQSINKLRMVQPTAYYYLYDFFSQLKVIINKFRHS